MQEFVNRKMLYQDQRGNCVFVGRDTDGKAETACLRGTLSDVHFTGDIEGSDARKGICFRNHADKVIVTESVIDSMSVMSILKEQGVDLKTYDYLSLNGVGKAEALYHLLKEEPKAEILLALDRDLGGVKAMKQISETLQNTYGIADEKISFHVPPHKKDWNEELTEKMRKFQPLKNIPLDVYKRQSQYVQKVIGIMTSYDLYKFNSMSVGCLLYTSITGCPNGHLVKKKKKMWI